MVFETRSAQEKALRANLDAQWLGIFAEIGGGEEVARWFFHAGKATARVAKAISAYDMTISDAVYGHDEHYVSRMRLESTLDPAMFAGGGEVAQPAETRGGFRPVTNAVKDVLEEAREALPEEGKLANPAWRFASANLQVSPGEVLTRMQAADPAWESLARQKASA